jgi:hypothetical protein
MFRDEEISLEQELSEIKDSLARTEREMTELMNVIASISRLENIRQVSL